MYFSNLLGSWGPHNPEIRIFLLLPLLTAVNLYLQLCHYNIIITILPFLFLQSPIYGFALASGPSFLLSYLPSELNMLQSLYIHDNQSRSESYKSKN